LRALADKLLFTVEKHGRGFTLSRTVDVSRPVRREGLSLDGRRNCSPPGSCVAWEAA